MSNSEDSSGTATPMTMSGSKDSTPRKTSAQDTAALRSTPVSEWSIQQVAAFFQLHGIDDAVVQKAAGEMIAGSDLLELENVSAVFARLLLCALAPRAAALFLPTLDFFERGWEKNRIFFFFLVD